MGEWGDMNTVPSAKTATSADVLCRGHRELRQVDNSRSQRLPANVVRNAGAIVLELEKAISVRKKSLNRRHRSVIARAVAQGQRKHDRYQLQTINTQT